MRDSEMFNILSNLDNKTKNNKVLTEIVNKDTAIKSTPEATMRNLLEMMAPTDYSKRLDESAVRAVGPKLKGMPGTHSMAKAGKKKHPANRFLVGGEEGAVPEEADGQLDETDPLDPTGGMGNEIQDHPADASSWGDELIEDLRLLLQQEQPEDLGAGIESLIQQYESSPEASEGEAEWDQAMGESDDPFDRVGPWDDDYDQELTPGTDPGYDGTDDEGVEQVDELKFDKKVSKRSEKAGMKDAKKGRTWTSKKTKFKDNESDPHAYLKGQRKGKQKTYEDEEEDQDSDIFGLDDPDDYNDTDVDEAYDPAQQRFVKTSNPYKTVTEDELDEEQLGAKQSFSDVFRSMEESDEESTSRLEKELFTELDEPAELKKNDKNGKYELNDSINEDDLDEGWNTERDAFKRQEQNAGLEDEDYVWNQQPWAVCFNGKPWKTFTGKQHAQNVGQKMANNGKTGITLRAMD